MIRLAYALLAFIGAGGVVHYGMNLAERKRRERLWGERLDRFERALGKRKN